MAIQDFLFNGQPPASVTKYGTSVQNVPQWYTDYTQAIAAKGNVLANQPYQAYGAPRIADFNMDQLTAFGQTRDQQGKNADVFQQAIDNAGQAGAGVNGVGMATPWLEKSGQATYDTVGNYMNPFTESVVDRIGTLGARNLQEKLMPAINSDFIRAGQYGSTNMMSEVGKALRDTSDGILAQQSAALESGYNNAMTNAQNDAQRFGTIGQTYAQVGSQDTADKLSAATKMSALAQGAQDATYQNINALSSAGAQQQKQGQSNLDLAYDDFNRQTEYPKQQLEWVNNLIKGYQMPTSTTTSSTYPLGNEFSVAPLSSALGNALKIMGS